MNFRDIKPFYGVRSVTASQSTSGSTSSDAQRSPPDNEKSEGINGTPRRRRIPITVTRNACVTCRKARAKCDGRKPCARCTSRTEIPACVYEVHTKHLKGELEEQVRQLRARVHMREQILDALCADEHGPQILRRLKDGETYEGIIKWLSRPTCDEVETPSSQEFQRSIRRTLCPETDMASVGFRWTSVTSDATVLDHLFKLYFTWVHPVHTLFCEVRFLQSYQNQSQQFCSSTLVNAICAMACHLQTVSSSDGADFEQLGLSFSHAVRVAIDPDDRKVTTIQAFAVLFLEESARGKGLTASSYIKVACENLSNIAVREEEAFQKVLMITYRGVRSINVQWAQVTFQAPASFHYSDNNLENDRYCYCFVPDQCSVQPSLHATTCREKEKLIAIISDTTALMYSPCHQPIQANQILEQFARYISWRQRLPTILDNTEDNSQTLPHVLSLLVLYSTAVTLLLQPLLDYPDFTSVTVEDTIRTHVQQGLLLLDTHYRTQYTCRYQCALQMFNMLHLCDATARFFPAKTDATSKDGLEAFQLGFDILAQFRTGFLIAEPLQELLRRSASQYSVKPPPDLIGVVTPPVFRLDDFINACTRPSYHQPVADIQARFSPTFLADWKVAESSYGFSEPENRQRRSRVMHSEDERRRTQQTMHIRNLVNTD